MTDVNQSKERKSDSQHVYLWRGYVTDNSTIVYMEEGSHSGCQCVKFECECCLVIDVPEIKLDNTICLQAAYLPKEYLLL
ncbi:hypothetical protein TNCT_198141 [Trichonephila clavata]|uniref:DUF4773 domain-containing protein n=1 Tax=Trichonephila clavata TaxID=2740835 RepID=A0A8X6JIE8_TRICU|nr:hypothetical protein TNCT_198141 [Trichonephila clavata]